MTQKEINIVQAYLDNKYKAIQKGMNSTAVNIADENRIKEITRLYDEVTWELN